MNLTHTHTSSIYKNNCDPMYTLYDAQNGNTCLNIGATLENNVKCIQSPDCCQLSVYKTIERRGHKWMQDGLPHSLMDHSYQEIAYHMH